MPSQTIKCVIVVNICGTDHILVLGNKKDIYSHHTSAVVLPDEIVKKISADKEEKCKAVGISAAKKYFGKCYINSFINSSRLYTFSEYETTYVVGFLPRHDANTIMRLTPILGKKHGDRYLHCITWNEVWDRKGNERAHEWATAFGYYNRADKLRQL